MFVDRSIDSLLCDKQYKMKNNYEKYKDIIKKLDPQDAVDISKVITTHEIAPKQYYMFKTGGPHFFSKCKNLEVVDPKYLDLSWPFIYNVKGTKSKIITGTIPKIRASVGYVNCRLSHATDKRRIQDFRNPKVEQFKDVSRDLEFTMHRLVAMAFIPNEDKNKTVVDHIDGNRCNYKVENLRWATVKQNSRGCAGQKSDPDIVYEIVSQTLWFNGKMDEYMGLKQKYNQQKLEAQHQMSFFESFEKELTGEVK